MSPKAPDVIALTPHITAIRVPFADIYTTVFLVKTEAGNLLFDTATYETDVTEIILPTLDGLGATATLSHVLLSHPHGDHAGGLGALLARLPHLTVIAGSEALGAEHPHANLIPMTEGVLLDTLRVIAIPGHTADAIGLLDTRTRTLLSGDGLQLFGIYGSGVWGANIRYPKAHLAALDRLGEMAIDAIYPAHNYHPCGDAYVGKEAIGKALDACRAPLFLIRDMIRENEDVSDEAIAAAYHAMGNPPTVGAHVFAAVRRELCE